LRTRSRKKKKKDIALACEGGLKQGAQKKITKKTYQEKGLVAELAALESGRRGAGSLRFHLTVCKKGPGEIRGKKGSETGPRVRAGSASYPIAQ